MSYGIHTYVVCIIDYYYDSDLRNLKEFYENSIDFFNPNKNAFKKDKHSLLKMKNMLGT